MKINLQEPFLSNWVEGEIKIYGDDRKRVILKDKNNKLTVISYARYLMSVKLGYIVPDEFEVDHEDNDKTNDDINNLQLLTPEQNRQKQLEHWAENNFEDPTACCTNCGIFFHLDKNDLNKRLKHNTTGLFCSKSCNAKYSLEVLKINPLIKNGISEEDKVRIKELRKQKLSVYKISEITGFARNTVMKYWN